MNSTYVQCVFRVRYGEWCATHWGVGRTTHNSPSGSATHSAVLATSRMSSNEQPKHQFLGIGRYHRNTSDADKFVLDLLQPRFPNMSRSQLRDATFTFDSGKGPFPQTFPDLKRQAQETGTLKHREFLMDDEPFFPKGLDVSTPTSALKVTSNYAGHTLEFHGPCRVALVESELCEDILKWRQVACSASAEHSFQECTRAYRAYVFACTSLVEAFLNRVPLYYRELRQHVEAIDKLHLPQNFDDRIHLWVETFCHEPIDALKKTAAWGHLMELREERNSLVHALVPQLGSDIRAYERKLNLVREGVGGFMAKLRAMQRLGSLPFIERLQTAPRVTYRAMV